MARCPAILSPTQAHWMSLARPETVNECKGLRALDRGPRD